MRLRSGDNIGCVRIIGGQRKSWLVRSILDILEPMCLLPVEKPGLEEDAKPYEDVKAKQQHLQLTIGAHLICCQSSQRICNGSEFGPQVAFLSEFSV